MQWNEAKPPQPKVQSEEDLKSEYKEICAAAGDKQFEISKLQAQLYLLNEKLFKLAEVFEKTDKKVKETLSAP
jgi:hypothetical protein